MKEITYSESRTVPDSVYIDVRSPEEFSEDHIPGSVNIPLFDNEERKEVGTIYRMTGRDSAILRGTNIVGGKLEDIVDSFLRYRDKNIIISCARGGMRSGSLASLLDSLGMTVFRLSRGYKGYRHYVMERMDSLTVPCPLFVLQGLTGAGKTEIIRKLPFAIDLEDMAGHRSSVFGGIGIPQKSQKRLESLLLERIEALAGAPYCVIEGESRKIGNLHIPPFLYRIMRESPAVYIDTPIERRIDIIYREYIAHCDVENIPAIVKKLAPKLGEKNTALLLGLYADGDIREFIRIMLEKYYDPLYRHSIEKQEYAAVISNPDTDEASEELRARIKEYMAGVNLFPGNAIKNTLFP
jgi:tRNA 2-selenouridine synthase